MISCSPQRYLANNTNELREAILTPSSVQPVDDSVLSIPVARSGTAQVRLTGTYTGEEEADYDIEIVDDAGTDNLISAPIFSGAGSGRLSNVAASGAAQNYTVELADDGVLAEAAFVDFEGVRIVARQKGTEGNAIRFNIDQTALLFTASSFSLLDNLAVGSGADTNGLEGPAFDWDTAVIGSNNQIPAGAHRIAFGDDTSIIYLQYKRFDGTKWTYHFVPEIKRAVAKGTVVKFVTGGRIVTVTAGGSPPDEVFPGIVTVFDLLEALKLGSTFVDVSGVVANDRSPTGQAARELSLRTDAHVEPSYGTGSSAATGFESAFANTGAGTELVTATCYAVTGKDSPLAHLGSERWKVKGSLTGAAGEAVTGVAFATADWGFTIPRRLPDGYGAPHGRFSLISINYVPRAVDVDPPPICPVSLELGPDAVDQSITLTYTARPSGDCLCSAMPKPNLRTPCLGIFDEGGAVTAYTAASVARLVDLYDWQADTIRDYTIYYLAVAAAGNNNSEAPFIAQGRSPVAYAGGAPTTEAVQEGLTALVSNFELSLSFIDAIAAGGSPDYQAAGFAAWDIAVAELKADVAGTGAGQTLVAPSFENLTAGQAVCTFMATDGTIKVRKAVAGGLRYGFVIANVTAPANATVYFWGVVPTSGKTAGTNYFPDATTAGNWGTAAGVGPYGSTAGIIGLALSATELYVAQNQVYFGLLADRYESRLKWVGMSAGLAQVGKSDADTIESGDGCWRDWKDPFYWEVVGSDGGQYAPAFNNHPYYSSRKSADGKAYYSTHEFAFQINVKCPEGLLAGDRINLAIGDAGFPATYQVGDVLTLPVIAAQPFYLAGGQDADPTQKWFVSGSVDGPLAQFTYLLSTTPPYVYSDGGLSFDLTPGGIPFAKGDKFTFGVEGAHYRWRKDGGAWSSPIVVPTTAALLDSGLDIEFITGASPSFVAGDQFKFRVLQPWAVSNIQTPTSPRWQWDENNPTLVADLGSVKVLDMAALALHTLPLTATVTIEGGTSPGVYTWTEPMAVKEGVIFAAFAIAHAARYVRLSLTGAIDAGIGWFWIGEGLSTELSADVQLTRSYKVSRGSAGLRNPAKFLGKTISGTVEWTDGAMTEDDMVAISALADWVKEHDDEPFILVPQVTRPAEAVFAQLLTDEVDMVDQSDYNRDAAFERRFSAKLPLAGFW